MAYGILKVDTIIFDQGGADQNVTVSGIYRAITSGVTVTGTISGAVLIGTTTVSGATVTGTAVQGTTVQGVSGTFTSLTGTTTTGTTANFVSGVFTTRISGTTVTGDTGQFTSGTFVSLTGTTITGTTINAVTVSSTTGTFGSITGTTITGTTINGATVNSTTGNFTSLTGVTVTGTTAQFVSGVFTTQLSGVTVTGTTASFTSGVFTALSGTTTTVTSGIFGAGSAAAPSITFSGDLNTGIYNPAADTLAFVEGGVEALRIDSSGRLLVGTSSKSATASTTAKGVIGLGGGGALICAEAFSLANNGTVDITVSTGVVHYFTGLLQVNNINAASGGTNTQSLISVLGNTQFGTITTSTLHTANGGAGQSFTITYVATGILRFTNTSGDTCNVHINYMGGGVNAS